MGDVCDEQCDTFDDICNRACGDGRDPIVGQCRDEFLDCDAACLPEFDATNCIRDNNCNFDCGNTRDILVGTCAPDPDCGAFSLEFIIIYAVTGSCIMLLFCSWLCNYLKKEKERKNLVAYVPQSQQQDNIPGQYQPK